MSRRAASSPNQLLLAAVAAVSNAVFRVPCILFASCAVGLRVFVSAA